MPANPAVTAGERPPVRFLKGLAWVLFFTVLFLGVAITTSLSGQAISKTALGWLSPFTRGLTQIGGVMLLTWLVRVKLNKQTWTGMALPHLQIGLLFFGCVCGAAVILTVSWIEYLMGWLHITRISTDPHWSLPRVAVILLLLIPALGTGLSEELAFRGYIFQTLGERAPVWVAALVMGIMFALVHFSVADFGVSFIVSTVLGSVMFLAMRFATGSLWFPIGFHAMWDWTQTYLVGLSFTGSKNDPALIQISQSGPPTWVGGTGTVEFGLLYTLAAGLTLVLALVYGKYAGRTVPWMQRLTTDGQA
jgi:membrane protease YdiL (CAAX protease family)